MNAMIEIEGSKVDELVKVKLKLKSTNGYSKYKFNKIISNELGVVGFSSSKLGKDYGSKCLALNYHNLLTTKLSGICENLSNQGLRVRVYRFMKTKKGMMPYLYYINY